MTKETKRTLSDKIFTTIGGLTLTVMVIYGTYRNTIEKQLLIEYGITIGKIIEFHSCNYNYCATYVYTVDQKEFEGHFGSSYFKCFDDTSGCVGHEFEVKYSLKNPSISEINLGKYNKKKGRKPTF
jgi:hypothetical protein